MDELSLIDNRYLIINKKLMNGRWKYRIIGGESPFADSHSDDMTMEDAYIALMRGCINDLYT